jgi:hypothetical protein
MRVRASALLCELHAHTTWSDGELSLPQLVDLYGAAGYDVLCVTDHVLRTDDPWPSQQGRSCVDATSFAAYREEIDRERTRAMSMFGLLLVPGLELTYNDADPDRACHAVALCPRCPATSTERESFPAGRRSSPVSTTQARSSSTCARVGRSS